MFDPQRMLGQMLGGALGGAFGGGSRRRRGGLLGGNSAMKAQVGIGLLGVAFAAYEHFQQQRGGFAAGAATIPQAPTPAAAMPPPPPGAQRTMPPPPPKGGQSAFFDGEHRTASAFDEKGTLTPFRATTSSDAIVVMQAMIAAAAADGRIDDDERAKILGRANAAGVDDDGMRFLETELATPKPLELVARAARREIAGDVYAASVLAISLDTPQERDYLDRLARALALDDRQRDEIHARLDVGGGS